MYTCRDELEVTQLLAGQLLTSIAEGFAQNTVLNEAAIPVIVRYLESPSTHVNELMALFEGLPPASQVLTGLSSNMAASLVQGLCHGMVG